MESHNQEEEQLEETEDLPADEESVCEPEPMQVDDSAKDIDTVKMTGCEKCSYEFATKNELEQHLEVCFQVKVVSFFTNLLNYNLHVVIDYVFLQFTVGTWRIGPLSMCLLPVHYEDWN